jgi:hypothetical protein
MSSHSRHPDSDRPWQLCAVNFCRCDLPKVCVGSEDCACGNPRVCLKSSCECGQPTVCPVPACTCGLPKTATDKWASPVDPLRCSDCDMLLPAHKEWEYCPWCALASEGNAELIRQMAPPSTQGRTHTVSRDRLDSENRRGAHDASQGRMRHDPWAGPFESHKDHDARRDAYNSGYNNTNKQRDRDRGFCFLTTACVEFAGLPLDCRELTVMRGFRDLYVKTRPDGESALRQYYATAPALVNAVKSSADSSTIFTETLNQIRLAVEHIEAGRLSEAFELYGATYSTLLNRFLPSNVHIV